MEDVERGILNHEREISVQMMEIISTAKECTPALFDYPDQQERIVDACKNTAKVVFMFKDTVKKNLSPLDSKKILDVLAEIETTAISLLGVAKGTHVVALEPTIITRLTESLSNLQSTISLFRILMGKIRISSSLRVISKISNEADSAVPVVPKIEETTTPQRVESKLQTKMSVGANSMDALPNRNLTKLKTPEKRLSAPITKSPSASRENINDDELKKLIDFGVTQKKDEIEKEEQSPADSDAIREELLQCPGWVLRRLETELKNRQEKESQLHSLQDAFSNSQQSFETWKTNFTKSFNDTLAQRDTEYSNRVAALERALKDSKHNTQVDVMQQLREKEKNFLLVLSLKEQEIEEKNNEIERLKRSQMDIERAWRQAKERIDKYMLEVEEWKRNTAEVFQGQLQKKDREISDMRETIELLMRKKGESKEQDNLVNQLLDYLQQPSETTADSKNVLQVILPDDSSVKLETNETMTLGDVLEIICAKKDWDFLDVSGPVYIFQHPDNSPLSAPLPLATNVATLKQPIIRMLHRDASLKRPELTTTASELNLSIGSKQRTVDELIKIMEKEIDSIKSDSALIAPCKGFDVENGKKNRSEAFANIKKLIDDDKNTAWYRDYFHNQSHVAYWADAGPRLGPVLVFLKLVDNEIIAPHTNKMMALVRTKYDDEWVFIPYTNKSKKRHLLKAMEHQCRNGDKMANIKLHKIVHPEGPRDILSMEDKLVTTAYKFGVLYVKDGQENEDDMFSNVEASKEFENFLEILGDRITLQGWTNYRGGLDVKTNTTGKQSIFTKHLGYDIMYHVSTMLPFFPADKQQLERKRHLGNDVCVIIFMDSDSKPFSPDCIKSEFNHVFCVIVPEVGRDSVQYKVSFAYKGGVGMSVPLLPHPPVFKHDRYFREFLLTKLINSERGAMYAPSFINKVAKTKELQMQAIADKFSRETK